jgi:signal transduction histidine kinase
VENQGGRIRAYSEPGKGATFIIELPILPKPDEGKQGE